MKSIERYLLAWTLGALLIGSALVGAVTYMVTLDEMNESFDADLRHVAHALAGHFHAAHTTANAATDPASNAAPPLEIPQDASLPEGEIFTASWSPAGRLVYTSDSAVRMPMPHAVGYSRLTVAGDEWVVYSESHPEGVTAAAQRVQSRQEMAAESSSRIFLPLFLLTCIVAALMVFALRKGLRPLAITASELATRSARSLAPIPLEQVPVEVSPLVQSINDLLARLTTSFVRERNFLADAAHELRTPITALLLQVQALRHTGLTPAQHESLDSLQSGVTRAQRLVEQMLHMSRADSASPTAGDITDDWTTVDLGELARLAVGRFNLRAEQCGIDLGVVCESPVALRGSPEQLSVLLNNLIENALRYTPHGGVVDVKVSTSAGHALLDVCDTGPGLSDEEKAKAFERFYRGDHARSVNANGSGLGLAIVRAICRQHSAAVELLSQEPNGLRVHIAFHLNPSNVMSAAQGAAAPSNR